MEFDELGIGTEIEAELIKRDEEDNIYEILVRKYEKSEEGEIEVKDINIIREEEEIEEYMKGKEVE